MEILGKLFSGNNGEARVKIMRFFLSNLDVSFESKEVAERLKLKPEIVRKEIAALINVSLLEKESVKNSKNLFYKVNNNFEYLVALYNLLFDFENMNKANIFEKFKKIGRIKLFVFAGVFVGEVEGLVDILIVSDNLKQKELDKTLNEMRISLGRELKYLVMDIDEYNYRHKMFDKTLHIVLEGTRIDWVSKI
jgi:hypothetical protein